MGFNIHHALWNKVPSLDISPSQAAVLLALGKFADDSTCRCHPSINRIALHTKCARTTVKDALRALRNVGLIDWQNENRHSNKYAFLCLDQSKTPLPEPKEGNSRKPVETEEEKSENLYLANQFADLCRNPANRDHDVNTFCKLIRERDYGSCQDLFFALASEIKQGEHDNATKIGAIITERIKTIPLKVINSPKPEFVGIGREPTQPRAGVDLSAGREPTVK